MNGKLLCNQPLKKTLEVEERNHILNRQYWGGYRRYNQIYQIEKDKNGAIQERLLVENHAIMIYNPFLKE